PPVMLWWGKFRFRLCSGRAEGGKVEAVAAVQRTHPGFFLGGPAGVAGEEGGATLLIFRAKERTGGIDQPSAGPDMGDCSIKDAVLQWRIAGEFLGRKAPFAVGLAPPCA